MQAKPGPWLGRRLCWAAQTKSTRHWRVRGIDYTLERLLASHGMHSVGRQHELTGLEHARDGIWCLVQCLSSLRWRRVGVKAQLRLAGARLGF